MQAGRLSGADKTGRKAGEVIGKYKMARHLNVTITDDSLAIERNQEQTSDEARLDGIHVIRTPVPEAGPGPAAAVTACKNLKNAERGFRHIKAGDPGLRPVFHRPEKRVRGHVLTCMLSACLTWHLRQARAPLTCTDEEPPPQASPVTPPDARHPPRRKPRHNTTRTAAATSATRDSWTISPPSPATSSASPAPPPPSPSSPSPPAASSKPSTSSEPPSPSP